MSYTPTTWEAGDIITAERMNKIEQGLAEGSHGLVIDVDMHLILSEGAPLSKTFAEIYDSLKNGIPVYLKNVEELNSYNIDYSCYTSLSQVIAAQKYYTTYRIYVLDKTMISSSSTAAGGQNFVATYAMITFSATGPSDYPVMLKRISTADSYLVGQ